MTPTAQQLINDLTNLFTIRLALDNSSDNPYFVNIRTATNTAIAAVELEYQLYLESLVK